MTLDGLPLHPLLVHAAVVLIVVTAAAQVAAVLQPRFREWLGWGRPVLAVGTAVLVQVTASLGEELEDLVGETPAVETHADWGELTASVTVALAAATVVHWLLTSAVVPRQWTERWPVVRSRWVVAAVGWTSVALAVAAVVLDVLTGHSGAVSVWG